MNKNSFLVWISSIILTPDDRFLIAESQKDSIKVFDLETKQELHYFQNNVYKSKEVNVHQENNII